VGQSRLHHSFQSSRKPLSTISGNRLLQRRDDQALCFIEPTFVLERARAPEQGTVTATNREPTQLAMVNKG